MFVAIDARLPGDDRRGEEIPRLCRHGDTGGIPREQIGLVDEPGIVRPAAVDAYGESVRERNVEHSVHGLVGLISMRRAADGSLDSGIESGRIWRALHEADRAAERARAVECSLWPAKYLNALQILKLQ